MLALDGGDTCVAVRPLAYARALEVFVHSPDRDGLFAAIVITLDRLGLANAQPACWTGRARASSTAYQVVPADARLQPDADDVARRLSRVLDGALGGCAPRAARSRRIFDTSASRARRFRQHRVAAAPR